MILAKKALVAAVVFAACSGAYAMEALNDDTLSDTTGQAGISILTNLSLSGATLTYQDTDGFMALDATGKINTYGTVVPTAATPGAAASGPYSATGTGGDLNIRGLGIVSSTNTGTYTTVSNAPITTTLDVGANSSGNASLDVGISAPQLNVTFSGIDVCKATVAAGTGPCASGTSVLTTTAPNLVIQGLSLNLQLGNSPQGHLGLISSTSPISITLGSGTANSVVVVDPNNTNGGLGLAKLSVTGLNLGTGLTAATSTYIDLCSNTSTVNCGSSTTNAGLQISFGASTMSGISVFMQGVTLGDTSATPSPSIGNVAINGINLGGTTVRMVGH